MNTFNFLNFERNETIYSLLSRVHAVSGAKNPLNTLKNVVGVRGYKPMSGLPTHINDIVENLSLNISANKVVEYHTHLPLYRPFITENKCQSIQSAMLDSGATKSRLGLLRNHIGANEVLRYCEVCLKENFYNYGFPLWYRVFTYPWVFFCPLHKQLLSEVSYHTVDYKERALMLPGTGKLIDVQLSDIAAENLISLSVQTIEIMESKNINICNQDTYHKVLSEMQLVTRGNQIKQNQLKSIVRNWLSSVSSIELFYKLSELLKIERCWASIIAGDQQGFHHPLKHLVILNSLNLEFRDLALAHFGGTQLDLPLPMNTRKATALEIKTAIFTEGSITKAAKKLGVCVTTLCIEADRLGIPYTRRPKTITDKIKSEVLRLYKSGKSSSETAHLLDISITSVNRIKRSSL